MDRCVLLTSTSLCVVSLRGDHSGCAFVAARKTNSRGDVNKTHQSIINTLNPPRFRSSQTAGWQEMSRNLQVPWKNRQRDRLTKSVGSRQQSYTSEIWVALNTVMPFYQYKHSPNKDKTVSQSSHFYNGNPYIIGKIFFILRLVLAGISILRCCLNSISISIIKIRWSYNYLILIMGILISRKEGLYIKMRPWFLHT